LSAEISVGNFFFARFKKPAPIQWLEIPKFAFCKLKSDSLMKSTVVTFFLILGLASATVFSAGATKTDEREGYSGSPAIIEGRQPDSIMLQINTQTLLQIDSVSPKPVSCFGANDGSIRIYTSGSEGGSILYSIDNGQTFYPNGGLFENLLPSIYIVLVMEESGLPEIWPEAIEISEPKPLFARFCTTPPTCLLCADGMINVGSITGGTPPYKILLNGVEQDTIIKNLGIAKYVLTVRDFMGCDTTVQVDLAAGDRPKIVAEPDKTVCPGDTVILTVVNPGVVEWINPPSDWREEIPVYPLVPTTYKVMSTKPDVDGFPCVTVLEKAVSVYLTTKPDIGEDITTCEGSTVRLDGQDNGYVDWKWNGSIPGRFLPVANSTHTVDTTLTLTVKDTYGCLLWDTVSVHFTPLPVVELGRDTVGCTLPLTLTANNPGDSYLWKPSGDTTTSITVSESGSYSLEITTSGCT
jgi:hypothetical protein